MVVDANWRLAGATVGATLGVVLTAVAVEVVGAGSTVAFGAPLLVGVALAAEILATWR